jgi:putative membrane protein
MSDNGHGNLPIPITLALIAIALLYWRGWQQLRHASPNELTVGRLAAFLSGLFTVWCVLGSPLAALDHELLTFHMVQHLVLMTVAAPLILLGVPPVSLLREFPGSSLGVGLLRWPPMQSIGRNVTHPVFCWLASAVTVIGWHVPALFELGLRSVWWHEIELASFFVAGLLFWWPVIESWPTPASGARWSVPLYLFLATLPCDALSAFLTFCGRAVYPHYLTMNRPFGISALGDQECAGALMWIWVTFAYLGPAAMATMQMLSPSKLGSKPQIV